MKILILNPPSFQRHLRGNYCSNISKGVYYYPAVDLLVQSGVLQKDFDVSVCDAIAEGHNVAQVLDFCEKERFEGILAVTGTSSRSEDLSFFQQLKTRCPNTRLLLTGGYLLTDFASVLAENDFVDGVLLDFSSFETVSFFSGGDGPFQNIAGRGQPPAHTEAVSGERIAYPMPRHDLFPLRKYHHPNARFHPFSLLMHSTGCPYRCDYCIYSITSYRVRSVEDVLLELEFMRSLGIHEAFFHDPTFGIRRAETLDLCRRLRQARLKVAWFCQTRTDHVDEELLTVMRASGCHAIMFGVESADESLLAEHHRRMSHEHTKRVYAWCRKLGIRTLSYLVIGLPGDTRESIAATVDLVKEIQSDFVSFNLAIPVLGTGFRERTVAEGLISNDLIQFDNSSATPAMATRHLSTDELSQAHRAAVRSFYFRLPYLFKRLCSIRSFYDLQNQIREGFSLLRQWL